jgi:hypothetical protein
VALLHRSNKLDQCASPTMQIQSKYQNFTHLAINAAMLMGLPVSLSFLHCCSLV